MKYVAILCIILFSSCSIPRTLDGDYSESFGKGWGGATFTFHKNGCFEYRLQFDVGGFQGTGNYKITHRKLKLTFSGNSIDTANSFTNTLAYKPKSDWQIHITVKNDTSNEVLPYAVIILSDTTGKKLAGATTDLDGSTTLVLSNYSGCVSVTIQYWGFKTDTIQLKNSGTYELETRLFNQSFSKTIPSKTNWTYRILFFEKNRFFFIKPTGKDTEHSSDGSVKRLDKIHKL